LWFALACAPEAVDPLPAPPPAAPAAVGPARADVITELYRDGFAPGSTIDDFVALSVPRKGPRGPVRVVKVLVDGLDTDAPTVYFIDTRRHETHWWFARALLGEQWSVERFAQRTYRREDRPAVALNLVLHSEVVLHSESLGHAVRDPITVELGEDDTLEPLVALRLLGLLGQRMSFVTADQHRLLWLPPSVEAEAALAPHAPAFAAARAGWLRRAELLADIRLQVLDPGVAYGTLRRLDRDELHHTVVSTRDVLLLVRVPNELPPVAGVITEELQTPLSHVAVASRARGTPNVAVVGASQDPAVSALVGKLVRLEVSPLGWSLREASLQEAEAFWASGRGLPVQLPPADLSVTGLPDLDTLRFADARAVGVKAANVAELHHLLPDAAPDGFAVPFSHYDRFVREHRVGQRLCRGAFADCAEEGRAQAVCEHALRRCLAGSLAGLSIRDYALAVLQNPEVKADVALREAVLDGVRFQMGHLPPDATFAAALDTKALQRWGQARVRLRSSTNAEDLPDFSGAGLYKSVSAHAVGPDLPSDEIREVWASVWTFRAVEERAAWGIPHDQVQMAVLVHASYAEETANGVLVTADLHGQRPDAVTMNLQPGDALVTNPEGGVVPEQLVVWRDEAGLHTERSAFSSLSPGQPVLDDAALGEMHALALAVRDRFAVLYDRPADGFALDLEVKRTASGTLIVKQARPFPMPEPHGR
jgi:pyruvate,water dikinase